MVLSNWIDGRRAETVRRARQTHGNITCACKTFGAFLLHWEERHVTQTELNTLIDMLHYEGENRPSALQWPSSHAADGPQASSTYTKEEMCYGL